MNWKLRKAVWAVIVATGLLTTWVDHAAAVPAVSIGTIGGYAGNEPVTLGWEFTANVDFLVTALGVFDDYEAPDGLLEAHPVGIWDVGTMALLVSATVPAGETATVIDQFRYVPVSATPLIAQRTYAIGAFYGGSLDFIDTTLQYGHSEIFIDPQISLNTQVGRFRVGNALAFPDADFIPQFGPSFLINQDITPSPVPEPSTGLILVTGCAGVLGMATWRGSLRRSMQWSGARHRD